MVRSGVTRGDPGGQGGETAHHDPVQRMAVSDGRASRPRVTLQGVDEAPLLEDVEHREVTKRLTVEVSRDDDRPVRLGERLLLGGHAFGWPRRRAARAGAGNDRRVHW